MSNYFITDICKVINRKVILNNEIIWQDLEFNDCGNFLKNAYKALGFNYPKFYKMDNLSKLTILAAEPILAKQKSKNIALLFMNSSGSLDTDLKHQKSIQNKKEYYPSPAIFVYTLPNICLGEVSIKHRLETENCFFLAENFDSTLMFNYAKFLLDHKGVDKVLCGWTDVILNDYNATLYLVEKDGYINHSIEELDNIFI